MTDQANRKLGRAPRIFDPTMPHMAAIRMMAGAELPRIPTRQHWADPLPDDLGMMLNDRLGDCTIAAAYHAMQVWSYHGRDTLLTEPDKFVLQTYKEFTGYNGTAATDQGAIEQNILRQWLTRGVPIQEGTETTPGPGRSYIRAAMEVNPHDHAAVKRAIYDCGCVYIGFDVPSWLMEVPELPSVWDMRPANVSRIIGGHAVSCPGYDSKTIDHVSWGSKFRMTPKFWDKYVREVYALVHPWWIEATGLTPFGLPLETLVEQMGKFTEQRIWGRG